MSDYFALLNEPRRPWLDADLLKQKFIAQSITLHPDKIQSAGDNEKKRAAKKFAELNAAYTCLLEPKSRLLHLLELELGAKPHDIEQIPGGLVDLFIEAALACKSADHFIAEKNTKLSPLLQVQFFERGQDWIEKLNFLQRKLDALRDELTKELKSLDSQWISTAPDLRREILSKLEELYRLFSYFNRWHGQIQERTIRLSF